MATLAGSSVCVALLMSVGPCSELPREPANVPPRRAAEIAGRALDLRLRVPPDPDSPSLANLTGSYSGGGRRRQALVLVFDSPLGTQQVTGLNRDRRLPGAVTVVERNVVVLYRGRDAGARRRRVASALRAALEPTGG